MKKILVPTDFSKCAENAIDFAVQSSKIFPSEITLLHSYEVNHNIYTDYVGVNKEFTMNMINEAEKNLKRIKRNIEETDGVKVDTALSTNSLEEVISEQVKEKKADLVIMGTLGASGIKEKLWGSRTASIIGKTEAPVLVIPMAYKWKKPRNILFATNQFEKDPRILNYVFELAWLFMARVRLAVFTDENDDKTITFIEHRKKISEYEEFIKEFYHEDTLASVHLTGEDFELTLQNFVLENNIDMLIMVTRQNNFWNRLFNQSKTRQMSYHTTIPLLAIPTNKIDQKNFNP